MMGRTVLVLFVRWVVVAAFLGAACSSGSGSEDAPSLGGGVDEPDEEFWQEEQEPPSGDSEDVGVEAIGVGYYEYSVTYGDQVIEMDSASLASAPAYCTSRGYKEVGPQYELGLLGSNADLAEHVPFANVSVAGTPGEPPQLTVWLYDEDPDDPRSYHFYEPSGLGSGELDVWMDGAGATFDVDVLDSASGEEVSAEGYVTCELEQA